MPSLSKRLNQRFKANPNPALMYSLMSLAPRGPIERAQKKRLVELVNHCAQKSPFYYEKFKTLGIDPQKVRGIEDLAAAGLFTTGQDIIDRRAEMICGQDNLVFETTGTSGRNKWLHFSWDEVIRMGNSLTVGLLMHGFSSRDRFLNCFNYSFWVPGFVFQKGIEKLGAFCVGASKTSPEGIYRRLEKYDINAIVGYPSLLLRVADLCVRRGGPQLKGVMAAGERLTEEARQYLQSVWRCKVWSNYGMTEACGGIGGECREQRGYHMEELQNLVEIIEPDADGFGEIVITNIGRRCMPLIRYRTGDVGRINPSPCPCGLPALRLDSVPGRMDEKIKIGTAYFLPNVFDRAVHAVAEVGSDYQLVAVWEGTQEVMELNVEAPAPSAALEEKVRRAVFENDPDMAVNIANRMFDLRVKINPPGSLLGDALKLKRFVDKRPEQEGRRDFSTHR